MQRSQLLYIDQLKHTYIQPVILIHSSRKQHRKFRPWNESSWSFFWWHSVSKGARFGNWWKWNERNLIGIHSFSIVMASVAMARGSFYYWHCNPTCSNGGHTPTCCFDHGFYSGFCRGRRAFCINWSRSKQLDFPENFPLFKNQQLNWK